MATHRPARFVAQPVNDPFHPWQVLDLATRTEDKRLVAECFDAQDAHTIAAALELVNDTEPMSLNHRG